jgi:predicted transposase/invertase (TIGR01784 family)
MITDPLFYRLFEKSPETFFLILGMAADTARAMAARYEYMALEFKETAHRADGVFQPKEPGLPLYFLEVQFYPLPNVYADVLVKAYTYLKQHDPSQPFCAVVLFAKRALEPTGLVPYQPLLDAGLLRRVFVDEMPEIADAPLGLAILYLIRQEQEQATATARALVARAKGEITDAALRANLVELIETVIIYKLPRLSREEIQTMLQVHDIRETRVYQEALQEGRQEGIDEERQRVRQEKLNAVPKLAARNLSAEEIADILGLELDLVLMTMGKKG